MTADAALWLALPATIIAVELVLRLKFANVLRAWGGVMKQSTDLMRDKTMKDDEKQAKMARASALTLGGTAKLALIILVAILGYLAVITGGITLLHADTTTIDTVFRIDFQVASVLTAIIYVWGRGRVIG